MISIRRKILDRPQFIAMITLTLIAIIMPLLFKIMPMFI